MGAYSPDAQAMGGFLDASHSHMAMRHSPWAAAGKFSEIYLSNSFSLNFATFRE